MATGGAGGGGGGGASTIAFPEEGDAAWAAIKRGDASTAWFLLTIDADDRRKLNFVASGRCGMRHTARFASDDSVRRGGRWRRRGGRT